jgi:hypothetical protein
MKESDQLATSFITPFGMYCYVTMPFGLRNAGATYQRCMNHVFGEHIGRTVEAYVDDIIVKTRKASDLLSDLEVTFRCLKAKGMKLNPEKCVFGVPWGMLLGFIVSKRGIEANPEKIAVVTSMGPSRTWKAYRESWDVLRPWAFSSRTSAKGACLCTASGQITFPPDVFSRDLHQPSVKIDDTPEPEAPLAWPEVPSAQSEAPSVQPEVPSAPEGETLHVEGERNGVTPDQNWQTPYLQYLHQGELPLDRAEARRLARRAQSFVLLGDGKELYHHSPSGILQRCISIAEGQELLREVHSGACGHHAAPRALVGNAFRQGFYWPTAVADATRIVRTCEGC